EEHLIAHAGVAALDELADGLGLVALGLEGGNEFEVHDIDPRRRAQGTGDRWWSSRLHARRPVVRTRADRRTTTCALRPVLCALVFMGGFRSAFPRARRATPRRLRDS